MPAFTFEKIAPVRRGPAAASPQKPRGIVGEIIDRLADLRTKRSMRQQGERPPRDEKPSG